ncbi:MAG: CoA transferase, partial [Dehalococcoidia bacterium]
QEVNTSLLGGQVHVGAVNLQCYLFEGNVPSPLKTNGENPIDPFNTIYQAGDGKWLCLSCQGTDDDWHSLCQTLGLDGVEGDPRFDTVEKRTRQHGAELARLLRGKFGEKPLSEWKSALEGSDLVWAPLRSYSEVLKDPQVLENEYVADLDHPAVGPIKMVGVPVQLTKTPGKVRMPAPDLGQHTEEILIEICGYSWDEIIELKELEVIN